MIKPLTSLRFFFALLVFLSHMKFLGSITLFGKEFKLYFEEGYIGVSFFFILSGFVLALNYESKIKNQSITWKSFYLKRFARIYPLHFLTFILAIPLSFPLFKENQVQYFLKAISNITLTQSFVPIKSFYFSFNAPSWSISNEFFFYLLFPVIIVAFSLYKTKTTLLLIFGSIAVITTSFFITNPDIYHAYFYINPIIRLVDFSLGILLYYVYQFFLSKQKLVSFTLLEILAIILLILFVASHQDIIQVARYSYYYWLPMLFVILVFSFQKGIVSKILSHKTLLLLGEISFGFYMFHVIIKKYFNFLNDKALFINNQLLIFLSIFTITLIVSYFSFIYYENPLNKFIKSKLNPNQKKITL